MNPSIASGYEAHPSDQDEQLAFQIQTMSKGIQASDESKLVLSYFMRYGYVPLREKSIQEAARTVASAPWIGLEGSKLESILEECMRVGLLEFSQSKELDDQWMLKLVPSPSTGDSGIDKELNETWEKAEREITRRADIVKVRWAFNNNAELALRSVLKNSTIKLMTYHGRTWGTTTGGILWVVHDLVVTRASKDNLRFEILVVGKDANERVREGATKEQHARAAGFGLDSLKNMDGGFVDVRTYGKTDQESLLRGLIIQNDKGAITYCGVGVWSFGHERGFYGREVQL